MPGAVLEVPDRRPTAIRRMALAGRFRWNDPCRVAGSLYMSKIFLYKYRKFFALKTGKTFAGVIVMAPAGFAFSSALEADDTIIP
jgi:hypothetical protein